MNSDKIFHAIGQISDDKIMEADTAAASKSSRNTMLKWGSLAACLALAIALTIAIPLTQRNTSVDPAIQDPGPDTAIGEVAELYDDLNIYFVTGENTLTYESVFIRYTPEDVFQKWAKLNNIRGVTLINYLLDSNGFETTHGDPGNPDAMVPYTVGDRFTIEITLSSEYQNYADGEDGVVLAESLEMTFREYHKHIDIAEFSLIISQQ